MAIIGGLPSPPPKWSTEVFNVTTIVNETIGVLHDIWEHSELVAMNGLCLTNGASYDYTISNKKEIIFNNGVLTTDGHIMVKYTYQ